MSSLINAGTFASAATTVPDSLGKIWKRGFTQHSATMDICTQMEGPEGSGSVFEVRKEFAGAHAQTLTFDLISRLGNDVSLGEQILEGNEEEPALGNYQIKVDIVRQSIGWTEKLKKFMYNGALLPSVAAKLLGEADGLHKQRFMMLELRNRAGVANTYYANSKFSTDSLVSADTLGTSDITNVAGRAKTRGAKPVRMHNYGHLGYQKVANYMLVADNTTLNPIKNDMTYLSNAASHDVRGSGNVIQQGGWRDYDGNIIVEFNAVDDDAIAQIGSPMTPRAYLGAPMLTAAGPGPGAAAPGPAIEIYGGGEGVNYTKVGWFKDFDGAGIQFSEEDSGTGDSVEHFILIYNHIDSPAGGDAGKFGYAEYIGTGIRADTTTPKSIYNVMEINERITAANPIMPAAPTVDWAGAPWVGNVASDHPQGAWIFQANNKGVPIAYSFLLGAKAAHRGYGSHVQYLKEERDFAERKASASRCIYGQGICKNRRGEAQNYMLVVSAAQFNGVPFPVVT